MDVYEKLNQSFPGGNAVNVAVYFVRMGGEASYTGPVGDDKYGKQMIDALKAKGVDVSHVRTLPGETSVTKVDLVNGERVLGDFTPGVLADYKMTDEEIDFLCGHDVVHAGVWGMVEGDLWRIKQRGTVPVAFDFSTDLENPMIDQIAQYVDYAFFAYDKEDERIRDFMKQLHVKGPKMIIVTLGANGSIVYDGNGFIRHGIVPVDVVDTMGAGDSFIAGFLKGILEKKPIDECMHMGASNSSVTLTYMGAW